MWTFISFLLLSTVGATIGNYTLDAQSAIRIWFQDAEARQAFGDVWDTEGYPLAAAADTTGITSQCRGALVHLGASVGMEALSMMDSSAKIPEGLFMLSLVHFGNWEECVGVRDVDGPMGRFHGKMCMVKFPAVMGTGSLKEEELPAPRNALTILTLIRLTLGQCVPSSCTAQDVQLIFQSITSQLPPVKDIRLSAAVEEIDCTTQDKPPLDTSDWVAVGLLIALGVIVVASTTYDLVMPDKNKKPLLASFSIVANGKKLLAVPHNKGDQTLSCVHGLRFLSMCWVIVGHRYMTTVRTPLINTRTVVSWISDWYKVAITNATLSVDTFLVLSGLLVGYIFFKQAPEKRKLNIPLYYIHRYIRLTPPLAMVALLIATLGYRVGWGPIWQSTLTEFNEICRDRWWSTLLYVNNYIDAQRQCVSQSWYLMVDMQLHWLSPIFLLTLVARPKIGMILLGSLCVASIIENFVLSYEEDYGANFLTSLDNDKQISYYQHYYTSAYGRYVPYLEGLALGYILGNQKYLQQKSKKLSFLHGAIAWLFVAAFLLVPLFTGYEFVKSSDTTTTARAFYNSLHRPAWGLGIVGVVYLCASRNGGPVNTLLSWWGFQFFGRFSYCMYLVHFILMDMQWANKKTPEYFSDSAVLAQYAGDLLISVIFAGILSVLCESPFIVLEKELLGKRANTSAPNNTIAVTNNSPPNVAISIGEKSEKEKE